MALQSISDFCGEVNLPGLIKVEYAPVDWINSETYDQIISDSRNWQKQIDLTNSWLTLPLLPTSDRLWRENERTGAQGKFYESEVAGITPKLRPAVTQQFEEMSEYRFIVRITDKNNKPWLIGTLDNGLAFSASSVTNSRNQYSPRFFNQHRRRAFGYAPVL